MPTCDGSGRSARLRRRRCGNTNASVAMGVILGAARLVSWIQRMFFAHRALNGESSEPHLRRGEYAVVDTADRELQHGELFLIQNESGARRRKIVQVRSDHLKGHPLVGSGNALRLESHQSLGALSNACIISRSCWSIGRVCVAQALSSLSFAPLSKRLNREIASL